MSNPPSNNEDRRGQTAVRIKTVVDHAKQRLENEIIRGDLKPGQQIKEEEVASRLGISRPPIREALKILEAEGLILRKPRRGVFVSEINEKDIWEIYTIKIALYELSIRLALEKFTESILKKLEDAVIKMEACVCDENCDRLRYQEFHERFHNMIIDLSGHQRLKRIISIMHNQVKRISYSSLSDQGHLEESCLYHRMIFESIKRRDKDAAIQLTREHIVKGLYAVQKVIAKSKQTQEEVPSIKSLESSTARRTERQNNSGERIDHGQSISRSRKRAYRLNPGFVIPGESGP
jgi:DNA-binding GntR family transcriptional regulator